MPTKPVLLLTPAFGVCAENDITLVIQGRVDRLSHVTAIARKWNGPKSFVFALKSYVSLRWCELAVRDLR